MSLDSWHVGSTPTVFRIFQFKEVSNKSYHIISVSSWILIILWIYHFIFLVNDLFFIFQFIDLKTNGFYSQNWDEEMGEFLLPIFLIIKKIFLEMFFFFTGILTYTKKSERTTFHVLLFFLILVLILHLLAFPIDFHFFISFYSGFFIRNMIHSW
jgi:hypothetical protein